MRDFYSEIVGELTAAGVLDPAMRVLVVCGGRRDRDVLLELGFRDVTISNIGPAPAARDHEPYAWIAQDAERLEHPDGAFDLCLVHSGLHHCRSPHRALLEMYRVASRAVLLFEPYDNLLTRVGVRLNIGQEYEHAGVHCNHGHAGGVGNSSVPNYVYRFTEREIAKAISSHAPHARHELRFFHRMRIPWTQLRRRRNRAFYHAVRAARPALKLVEVCLPKQSNNFAALVLKPDLPAGLQPWLRAEGDEIRLDDRWLASRYG
jgi:SAM-dependent methyltransferase